MSNEEGKVNIHGRTYLTVAYRVNQLREKHPTWSILTEIISAAELVVMKATIQDEERRILATGHAEEKRGSTNINKTSALENAETSAIGRALAALGYGGTEYASADEVANAISQQNDEEGVQKRRERMITMLSNNIDRCETKASLTRLWSTTAADLRDLLDEEFKQKAACFPEEGVGDPMENK